MLRMIIQRLMHASTSSQGLQIASQFALEFSPSDRKAITISLDYKTTSVTLDRKYIGTKQKCKTFI